MSSEVQTRICDENPVEQVPIDLTLRAHTYLKKVEFSLAMYVLGLETNPLRARLIRMDAKTVAGALEGKPISGEFMGNTITSLRPYATQLARVGLEVDLNTFFEVTDV